MPKGEHFKKVNPRIHQVSFKVNKSELDQLNKIVSDVGMSIPEWIREQIMDTGAVNSLEKISVPKKVKTNTAPKPAKNEIDTGVHKGEQTSLF